MTDEISQNPGPAPSALAAARAHWLVLGLAAAGSLTVLLPTGLPQAAAVSATATLALILAALGVHRLWMEQGAPSRLDRLKPFLAKDSTPSFVLDADQSVVWTNDAAEAMCPGAATRGITQALSPLSADAPGVLQRLRRALLFHDYGAEDVVIRRGHAKFTARGYPGGFSLLRIEAISERVQGPVTQASVPILTVSRNGTVLAMNEALRRKTGTRVRRIEELFVAPLMPEDTSGLLTTSDGQEAVRLHQTMLTADRREILMLPALPSDAGPALPEPSLDALPVAVASLAPDGRVLALNTAARSLLRLSEEDTPANLGEVLAGPGRPLADWLREASESPAPLQPEVLRLRRPGDEGYLQVALCRNGAAAPLSLPAVLHDATELKTLEAQFVQSQKMQAIGQLAGGIAHDFNNLLTAISGHCDLLLLRHEADDPEYGDLLQINQNANRAAGLVGQLLAFSRKQTLQMETIDLRDTLSELTHLLNRLVGEPVSLSLHNDPDLCAVRADRRQLEQVIINLVVNARDAMPKGGAIRIETERLFLHEPVRRQRAQMPAGDYVCVKVSDQGDGIPPEDLPKIFEPFFTTKRTGEGTGLGLSTAYGIVKQTGGFIFAESVPGQGTEFQLFFPAHAAAPGRAETPATEPARAVLGQGDGVILLVEDEAPVRAFAARALRLSGYTVLEAETGEAALEMLSNPALEVDVFVTDVIMPGLDGPSWVRDARKARPQVKVVFMSGYAEDLLSDAAEPVPDSTFLPKPFSLAQLTETVQTMVA